MIIEIPILKVSIPVWIKELNKLVSSKDQKKHPVILIRWLVGPELSVEWM